MQVSLSDLPRRYAYLDPASGKRDTVVRAVRARSAITVCTQDTLGRVWVLDAWAKRAPTSEIVETFVTLCERWHVTIAGIEDLGQQYLLVEPILALAQVKNYEIPLATVKPSFRVDKNFRIRTVLDPLVREGRLIIGDNHDDLWSELTTFPMNSTKDLVDSLTSCVALMPPKQQKRHHDSEVEGVAAYLRDSGVAPSVIERKIQQLRFERGEQEFEEPTNPWQKLFEIRKVVQNG